MLALVGLLPAFALRHGSARAAWQPPPAVPPLPPVRPAPALPLYLSELGPNRFARPSSERTPLSAWLHGRYGLSAVAFPAPLRDLVIDKMGGDAPLWPPDVSDEPRLPLLLPALPHRATPCTTRPVLVIRYGAESDRFPLLDCDGGVADTALDRLGVLLRPPDVARPDLPLPDEPVGSHGEWVDGVKMPPPRVLWLLSEIANAFPWRALYVYSGYRPAPLAPLAALAHPGGSADRPSAAGPPRPRLGGGHGGLHNDARAVDLAVHGIPTTKLYEVCRKLPDTGCGFYPNHPFVHVDVRRPGLAKAAWIDTSFPGEPSVYVRSWPGVADADVFTEP